MESQKENYIPLVILLSSASLTFLWSILAFDTAIQRAIGVGENLLYAILTLAPGVAMILAIRDKYTFLRWFVIIGSGICCLYWLAFWGLCLEVAPFFKFSDKRELYIRDLEGRLKAYENAYPEPPAVKQIRQRMIERGL
jgi:hypothetical protein